MKLDGYVRVSRVMGRDARDENGTSRFHSPQLQREKIAAWAKLHGHEIAAWHEDLDQSGGTMNRPGFEAAMRRVEAGDSDGFVVMRLDRFARSLKGAVDALERIRDAGATFASVEDGFDLTTATGRAFFGFVATLGQLEREQKSEGWKEIGRRTVEQGRVHRAPFGYRKRDDGTLEPDPVTGPVVADLFRRRAQGASWQELRLLVETVAPGRPWSPTRLREILRNRAYLGEVRRAEHVRPDAHGAIVTLAEWEAAQPATASRSVNGHEPLLLSGGLARCSSCRYAMAAWRSNGVVRYACRRAACPARASIGVEALDEWAATWLLSFFGGTEQEPAGEDGRLAQARRALVDAEARQAAFLDSLDALGSIEPSALRAQADKRAGAVERARGALADLEAEDQAQEARVRILRREWEAMPRSARREVMVQALDTVYVRQGRGPVGERTLFYAKGDDPNERPVRGTRGFQLRPVESWPEDLRERFVPTFAKGRPEVELL